MPSKAKLFPLTRSQEVRVEFRIARGGETYALAHLFRQPTAADKKAFWGHMSASELAADGGRKRQSVDYLGAVELLYARCILRVEGYELPEGAALEEIIGLIDLDHKRIAVEKLLASSGTLAEEVSKN